MALNTPKKRYWTVELEDGTTLYMTSTSDAAPKFAVECRWETQPLRQCGYISGLGTAWETDTDADPVPAKGWALFQRRTDAKAAAENNLPYICALEERDSRYLFAFTKLSDRRIVKVAKAEKLEPKLWRQAKKRAPSSRRLARGTDYGTSMATKRRVEELVAKDAELREQGFDTEERKRKLRFDW